MVVNQGAAARARAALGLCSAMALLGTANACDTTAREATPAPIAADQSPERTRAMASAEPAPEGHEGVILPGRGRVEQGSQEVAPAADRKGRQQVVATADDFAGAGTGLSLQAAQGHGAQPPPVRAFAAAPKSANGAVDFGRVDVLAQPAAATTTAAAGARPLAVGGSGPIEVASPLPVPSPRLDPNARYATTYRPGGAALAAFDAAISRGQIPGTYKDLVGDFGTRYAPSLAAPTDGALAVAVDTERAAVGPQGGAMNLLVSLASSEAMPSRAPLSVHIVLDISGSMAGQAIEDAKRAAEATVSKLDAADDFSMVTFSNTAQVLVSDGPIGTRRPQVLSRIREVHADGGTNISAGLDLGYAEARAPGAGDEAVRIVMLLSDGHANAGDTDPWRLGERAAHAFQNGIQTSAFGLGPDYDAPLMSGIADQGAGGYYYLADSSQIEPALAREIDARLRPVATAVELRVRLRPDVSASRVFGSRELTAAEADAVRAQEIAVDQHEKKHGIASDRETDATGGMRFFIPAFARADRHATMVTLQLPPGVGSRSVGSVEVRYKDRILKKNVTRELSLPMRWAASDAESASSVNPNVQRVEQAFAAGDTILEAANRVDHGDRGTARALLVERAAVMRISAAVLAEPRLAEDGARLERLADAVGGAQPLADALPLVVMLRGSGYGYL